MKRVPKKRRYTPEYVAELTQKLIQWINTADELWLGKFAQENKFHRDRMLEMAETNEEFASAFLLAKQAQENWLVTSAMSKKIDCTMAIFALKNVAGWRDKQEIEHSGQLQLNLLNTAIKKARNIDDRHLISSSN